jgi:hypothetical protein
VVAVVAVLTVTAETVAGHWHAVLLVGGRLRNGVRATLTGGYYPNSSATTSPKHTRTTDLRHRSTVHRHRWRLLDR